MSAESEENSNVRILHSNLKKRFLSFVPNENARLFLNLQMSLFVFLLIFNSGCNNFIEIENTLDHITFVTDKITYTVSDSVDIILENGSTKDITFGLRCGTFLEMSFQKKLDGVWSQDSMFWFMTLKCATLPKTLSPGNIFNFSVGSKDFNTTGTFRLVLSFSTIKKEDTTIIYSNEFKIN